ncbi:MAG: hypothetical protein K6E79_07040 [Pseudobutyrivibrio sp.]|nr:hypothetical protein [Pseudobutyrivibrio sp.]
MIDRSRLLSLGYYAKAPSFTGSDHNKYYKIEKVLIKNPDETEDKKLQATIWPGPFSSENTPEEKKLSRIEDFTEEGLQALVDWMNSTDTL